MNQNGLHWAAKRNMKEMAEVLILNGIDVFWKDMAQKKTPCDLAKKNEFYELARRVEDFMFNQQRKNAGSIELEKIDLNFQL